MNSLTTGQLTIKTTLKIKITGRKRHSTIIIKFRNHLILWTVSVSAALANACGLGISNLTNGAVPSSWGAVIHSLIGFAFVWFGGFSGFEKLMRALILAFNKPVTTSTVGVGWTEPSGYRRQFPSGPKECMFPT